METVPPLPLVPLPTVKAMRPPRPAVAAPVPRKTAPEFPAVADPDEKTSMPLAPLKPALADRMVTTPLEVAGSWARYQLQPITGQRHQLRVHMAALGLPICGDGIYPVLTPEGQTDYDKPLQLLARSIAFKDPTSGENLFFESQLRLGNLR